MKPAIVIVAYNRPNSLRNLLKTISQANYKFTDIPLIISIDYTKEEIHHEVLKVAQDFNWKYGNKKIIEHKENLGLRNHILSCGDMTQEYGAVIVLEDDLRVSSGFYKYATASALYYENESNVAGISLYAYEYEELGWYTFYPKNIGGDTFFMQWAASWGQLWTKEQWNKFRTWYQEDKSLENINIPDRVKRWKKSWKKYYIGYLVENNLYFAYPYKSYTTLRDALPNELAVHNKLDTRTNNVLLVNDVIPKDFVFSNFSYDEIKYDVFFQPRSKKVFIKELNEEIFVEFDFFGTKNKHNITAPYLCSIKEINHKIKTFSNKLIPYEDNVIKDEDGLEFNFGLTKDFSYKKSGFLSTGKYLYHSRKIYAMKEMLQTVAYRILYLYLK